MSSANRGSSAKQTVLIVGDGAGAKELKEKLIGEGYDVVGAAATAAAAAKIFKAKEPQVLVLRLSSPHLDVARVRVGHAGLRRRRVRCGSVRVSGGAGDGRGAVGADPGVRRSL